MRTAVVAASLALLLSGCGSDAGAELRSAVADVTAAANGRDADGVRSGVEVVLARIDDALRDGAITPEQGARIREQALALQAGADSIDADLIAEQEAAEAQRLEQERLEAERLQAERQAAERQAAEAAAEAERQRLEQERQAAEEAQKAAEEAAKKAEQERKKAEEEAEEKEDDDEAQPSPTASPAVVPSPTANASS